MCAPNRIGAALGEVASVTAMTDVTGFGLAGHLLEMCEGSGVRAEIEMDRLPLIEGVDDYLAAGAIPGGTERNFRSYGKKMQPVPERARAILCDPQTSGGLLVAVRPDGIEAFRACIAPSGAAPDPIGTILPDGAGPRLRLR